jgi:DNA-binding response OmpR family regulator
MSGPPELSAMNPALGRILIVEDEPLIAENLRATLVDAGFEIAGVSSKVETALKMIEGPTFDGAIVDANLAGVSASAIIIALSARQIPFIVLSGYTREQLPGEFSGGLFIQKPYRIAQLVEGLTTVLTKK